jgi:Rps23 Pro-64 3,4-dihydroxylase Tpa1-like proline 4-hydroxylase
MDKLEGIKKISKTVQGGSFEEVAPSVFIADILTKENCDEILSEFQGTQQWEQAKIAIPEKNVSGINDIIGVIDMNQRHAYRMRLKELNMSDKPMTVGCLHDVQRKVSAFTSARFGLDFKQFGGEEIVRYPEGGLFKPHTDTHKGNAHRAFTVIIYLNDDYKAGETGFPDLNYQCSPKTGRVLVFLSTQLHSGLPVLSGEKNIIVFWGYFPGSADTGLVSTYFTANSD